MRNKVLRNIALSTHCKTHLYVLSTSQMVKQVCLQYFQGYAAAAAATAGKMLPGKTAVLCCFSSP
jgi:hypothetical protein